MREWRSAIGAWEGKSKRRRRREEKKRNDFGSERSGVGDEGVRSGYG